MESQRDHQTEVINLAFTLVLGIVFGFLLNLTFGKLIFNEPVIGIALGICIGILSSAWLIGQRQKNHK